MLGGFGPFCSEAGDGPETMTAADQAWEQVVRDFRHVCLLKREGKLAESERVLSQVLPASIASWSQLDPQDSLAKRMQLQAMFDSEQRRLDEAWALQQMVFSQLSGTVISELKQRLSDELRSEFNQWLTEKRIEPAPSSLAPVAAEVPSAADLPWKARPAVARSASATERPQDTAIKPTPQVWRF